jgi:hypothetical protein
MDVEQIVSDLRAAHGEALTREVEKAKELEAAKQETRRLLRALDALTGESKKPGRKPKTEKTWTPSEEKVEAIREWVEQHPDGVTVPQAVEDGIVKSKATADRTLRLLRDNEVIRLAGKRGMALLYKPQAVRGADNGA